MPIYEDENKIKEKIYKGQNHINTYMDLSTYGYTRGSTHPNGKTTWILLSYGRMHQSKRKAKKLHHENYAANRTKYLGYSKKWHQENKENVKLQYKNWYRHHHAEELARSKEYYRKNRIKILSKAKKQHIEQKNKSEHIREEK